MHRKIVIYHQMTDAVVFPVHDDGIGRRLESRALRQ
jgi:hypothetical protein